VLEEFVPAHPGVRVSVQSGQTAALLPALLRRELHFLVADAEVAQGHDELEIQPLGTDPLVAALRPDHPLARKRRTPEAEASRCPFIGASTAPRFERWTTDQTREHGEKLAPSLTCDNYEVLARLAERSEAIVIGPRTLLAGYERAGRLKIMPWPTKGPDTELSLIRSKGRNLSPAAEKLMALFVP
jgi:DNA-binding transcriptional LysR family regulator